MNKSTSDSEVVWWVLTRLTAQHHNSNVVCTEQPTKQCINAHGTLTNFHVIIIIMISSTSKLNILL